jgi:hypothetical protein
MALDGKYNQENDPEDEMDYVQDEMDDCDVDGMVGELLEEDDDNKY